MRFKLLTAVALLGFTVVCVGLLVNADKAQKIDKLEIQSKTIDLKAHQLKGEQLQEKLQLELNKDVKDQERLKQLEEENTKYQQETEQLKRDLQAKLAEKNRLASISLTKKAYAATAPQNGCEELKQLLINHGVAGAELTAAVELGRLESNCRKTAVNKSSGACNYFQEYKCGKWGGLSNTDAHIRGAIGYAQASYGSFQNALAKWRTRSPAWW